VIVMESEAQDRIEDGRGHMTHDGVWDGMYGEL
jgi:hypothetical protein